MMRRTRTRQETVTEEVAKVIPGQFRRTRSRQANPDDSATKLAAQESVQAGLKLIAKAVEQMENLKAQIEDNESIIEGLMRGAGLKEVREGIYTASILTKAGRASSTVNVARFRKKVDAKTFEACINIPIGVAQQHLSEREMIEVTDKEYGEDKEVFEIKAKKKK